MDNHTQSSTDHPRLITMLSVPLMACQGRRDDPPVYFAWFALKHSLEPINVEKWSTTLPRHPNNEALVNDLP